MSRPRLDPAHVRRPVARVWLNSGEHAEVAERASAAGLPLAEFVRVAALAPAARPIQAAARPDPASLAAYSELARLAANLNQIAAHANSSGGDLPPNIGEKIDAALDLLSKVRLALLGGEPND